jgi:hypothetical protein
VTFSPRIERKPAGYASCAQFDAALFQVARRMGEALLLRSERLDPELIQQALRDEGSPYVWPHAFTRQSEDTPEQSSRRLDSWLASFDDGGERRCGIADVRGPGGRRMLSAIAVDVLADLAPLPRHARIGQWMQLSAKLLVRGNGAKVFVLGPRGMPRSVPTSFDGQRARARFSVDQPGRWLVQLVADVAGGPRQVLEAEIIVGDTSEARNDIPQSSGPANDDPVAALDQMLRAARAAEGLPQLTRDALLDRLAGEQARALLSARRVAHDLGAGDPEARITAAGLRLIAVGENVVHASTAERAHRALWRSPSHRANLLSPHFDCIGIGVAVDPDGSLWVCELFGRSAQ